MDISTAWPKSHIHTWIYHGYIHGFIHGYPYPRQAWSSASGLRPQTPTRAPGPRWGTSVPSPPVWSPSETNFWLRPWSYKIVRLWLCVLTLRINLCVGYRPTVLLSSSLKNFTTQGHPCILTEAKTFSLSFPPPPFFPFSHSPSLPSFHAESSDNWCPLIRPILVKISQILVFSVPCMWLSPRIQN